MAENRVKDLEWQLQEVAKDNDNYQKENKELKNKLEKAKEIIREYIRLSLQEDKDIDANIKLFQKAEAFIKE